MFFCNVLNMQCVCHTAVLHYLIELYCKIFCNIQFFTHFYYYFFLSFFRNCLPLPRYWTYEDVTWYGRSLGAIVYFCILVTLKGHGQGHSSKFNVKFVKFSEWSEKSSERFWRCKYANFAHDLHLIGKHLDK